MWTVEGVKVFGSGMVAETAGHQDANVLAETHNTEIAFLKEGYKLIGEIAERMDSPSLEDHLNSRKTWKSLKGFCDVFI